MYGGTMKYGGGLKRYQNGDQVSNYTTNPNNFTNNPAIIGNTSYPPAIFKPDIEEEPRINLSDEKQVVQESPSEESPSLDPATAPKDSGMKNAVEDRRNKKVPYIDVKRNNNNLLLNKSNIKYGWSTPDKLNLLNSMINMAGVRKYSPFEPSMKLSTPQTYYADPSRALAANAEQMNAARQAASMYAGPQSRYSFNAGQFGKNAADIIGQYANQNIGIGNQAAQQASNIANQQMQYDTQRMKRLYDAGVLGEQQYQNAMRQARAAVLQSYAQGHRNAADIYNLSMTESPYFGIRPGSNLVYFHSPKSMASYFDNKNDNTSQYMSPEDFFKTAKSYDPNVKWSDYNNYLEMMTGRNSSSTTRNKKVTNPYT